MITLTRPIVAVDFDSTIAHTIPEVGVQLCDTDWAWSEVTDFEWVYRRWGKDKFYEALVKAHNSPHLEEIPGAVIGILRVAAMADVVVLTANSNPESIKGIRKWLDRHGLHNISLIAVEKSDDKFKHDWAILIDDHPTIDIRAPVGRKVIQFPQPYNTTPSWCDWEVIPAIVKYELQQMGFL